MEEKQTKQKKNPIIYFLTYLKNLCYDFRTSFKYNNMKLAALLVAVPGIFLGFFLGFHAEVVNQLSFIGADFDEVTETIINKNFLGFDYSGLVLFLLVLFGILNIFTAASMSSKKNLGSVVAATITTSLIVICAALYLFAIFYYISLLNNGKVVTTINFYTINLYMSIISVILSVLTSVAGVIIGFVRYDRTYEKVVR